MQFPDGTVKAGLFEDNVYITQTPNDKERKVELLNKILGNTDI